MINKLSRRLIFHLWLPKQFTQESKKCYEIHLKCLKYYSQIFTSSVFVISMDNINDKELYTKAVNDIIDCGYIRNVSFICTENNIVYREGLTFYNEIIAKLDKLDGITFFGHSKGMSNVNNGTEWGYQVNNESVYKWIIFMYFMNMGMIDIVDKCLLSDSAICYGTMLEYDTSAFKNKNKWIFAGSFQWINTKKLNLYINTENCFIPDLCDRTFAETFLGNILPFDLNLVYTYDLRFYPSRMDSYQKEIIDGMIEFLLKDKKDEYENFYNEITLV